MTKVFLSYACADGSAAPLQLRNELTRSGFEVWQDIENVAGGRAWKEQLRAALQDVDAVVVLLTPNAADSKYVEWEWEMAQVVQKPVIPLLIETCDVPDELARLHYHNLSTQQDYPLGLMALIRDLNQLDNLETSASNLTNSISSAQRSTKVRVWGNANFSQIILGNDNTVDFVTRANAS